jgi:hypothetical protein
MAFIVTSKFAVYLPLYRLEDSFSGSGLRFPEPRCMS